VSPRVSDLILRSQSDERLVSLARDGHVRAFGVIVERYGPELAVLARRLSPDGRGEDILQQAFLSAFAALRRGSEVRHLRGWLYQIVRNVSAREPDVIFAPLESTMPAADTLEDVVQRRALARSTLSELARLPARQREAMIGTAVDGRARAEVARAMGLSEGAVRQLVHRARTTLRSAITAVTPWPLARWLEAARAGGVPAGGVAMKLGAVVASGTLATGIATVAIHVGGPDRPPAPAFGAGHPRSGVRAATAAVARRSVAVATSAGALQAQPASAAAAAEVSLRRVVRSGQPNARRSTGWRGDRRAGLGWPGRGGGTGAGGRGGRHDGAGGGVGGSDAQGGGGRTGAQTGVGGSDAQGGGGRTGAQIGVGGSDAQGGGGRPDSQIVGGGQGSQTGGGGQDSQTGGGGQGSQTGGGGQGSQTGGGGDSQSWAASSQTGNGSATAGGGN
jgi:RNA polymerase sigma factor (sigma-70 family)